MSLIFHPEVPRKERAVDLASLDIHIGQRLRWRRKAMGFSQERLGYKLGMSFQQVQKYENGTNSLSARRLYQMSQVMGVPITFFFDGYADMHSDGSQAASLDKLNLALVRACLQIQSPTVKLAFIRLIKTVAKTSPRER